MKPTFFERPRARARTLRGPQETAAAALPHHYMTRPRHEWALLRSGELDQANLGRHRGELGKHGNLVACVVGDDGDVQPPSREDVRLDRRGEAGGVVPSVFAALRLAWSSQATARPART